MRYVCLFSARPLTVYNHCCLSEVLGKLINCMKMLEKLKKRTNTSIFKNNNKNTLQNEDFNIVLLSELWDPTVLSCYI